MPTKLAVKRLTKSDLTFFKWHFENNNAGNQKAINLNADVFAKQLFPAIAEEAKLPGRSGRFSVDLDLFGPDNAPRLNLQRKIIKFGEYKNWRLNGEFVDNPPDNPTRFNTLREGDCAIFEFSGTHYPEAVRLALVSQAHDNLMHAACSAFLGSKKMAGLSGDELDNLISTGGGSEVFPLAGSSIETALEDAAQGGLEGVRKLQMRATTRPVTKDELRTARAQTDEIGTAGEEFINDFFGVKLGTGEVTGFTWTSLENAVSPFDFTIEAGGTTTLVDVKATKSDFNARLHISINELLHMRDGGSEYRVYRVYMMKDRKAALRISEPLANFASNVIPVLEQLPNGVKSDGISVDPRTLAFGPEIQIELNELDD